MVTKLYAARHAARSGAASVIACGREPRVLERLAGGETLGTLLLPSREPLAARKQWIANQLEVRGALMLDDGAARVLRERGSSLLPIGVTEVRGAFIRGDMVACIDAQGEEIARGLVNYDAGDARQIMRKPSHEIQSALGYVAEPELIHRDNLVLV